MRSTFDDELDNLVFLGGLGTIKPFVGSMLLSSTSNRFLMSSLFNFESTNITSSFVLKFLMSTYEVAPELVGEIIILQYLTHDTERIPGKKCQTKYLISSTP
jgi:hypothetical protein